MFRNKSTVLLEKNLENYSLLSLHRLSQAIQLCDNKKWHKAHLKGANVSREKEILSEIKGKQNIT